jgi:glyoxylase-like metal-dependent hydrolase (beta-lactamase superfamily II)
MAIAARMPHVRFLKMPWPEEDVAWRVRWQPLTDGELVAAGDSALAAIHTPGHSPDHLCFWHQESGQLFCGDLAWKGSTVVIPSSQGGDVAVYLSSLQRVLQLQPETMLPAHGPVIERPMELLREYIEHRALREQQVLSALRSGVTNPDEMVARIYPSLAAALVPVARESVLAHLVKLEREGRVAHDGERWRVRD